MNYDLLTSVSRNRFYSFNFLSKIKLNSLLRPIQKVASSWAQCFSSSPCYRKNMIFLLNDYTQQETDVSLGNKMAYDIPAGERLCLNKEASL